MDFMTELPVEYDEDSYFLMVITDHLLYLVTLVPIAMIEAEEYTRLFVNIH
jgi:hypothetical protein